MICDIPGVLYPYRKRVARAPRVQCPCVWDWIAKTEKVVGLLVSILLLALLTYKLYLLVLV